MQLLTADSIKKEKKVQTSLYAHWPKGYSNLTPHPVYESRTVEKAATSVHVQRKHIFH